MFPYHLRPPSYGGKLKKEKQQQCLASAGENGSDDHITKMLPYYDGGPLQRAMQADLLDLQSLFLEKLTATTRDDKAGTAFGVFKQAFARSQTARLHHSSVIPPRVDHGSYTQLLYAACLNLLHKQQQNVQITTRTTEQPSSQPHGNFAEMVFAIFALYTLYETSTLPTASSSDSSTTASSTGFEMLPIGVQDPQNPKALYRKAFRRKIRIDRCHYLYLLQVRDMALQIIHQWERQKQQKQLITIHSDDDTEDEQSSTKTPAAAVAPTEPRLLGDGQNDDNGSNSIALARDAVIVIDRLIIESRLQPCSYTGPMGLEALAGHSLYPYPESEKAYKALLALKKKQENQTKCNNSKVASSRSVAGMDTNNTSPSDSSPSHSMMSIDHNDNDDNQDLATCLSAYMTALRNIRMPPPKTTKKNERIREALTPVFHSKKQKNGTCAVSILHDVLQGREQQPTEVHEEAEELQQQQQKPRHVTFGSVVEFSTVNNSDNNSVVRHANGEDGLPGDERGADDSTGHDSSVNKKEAMQLVLPDGLSEQLQTSLETAVQTLLDRNPRFLTERRQSNGVQAPSRTSSSNNHNDDISTLGHSRLSSVGGGSGTGNHALAALLAKAREEPTTKLDFFFESNNDVAMGKATSRSKAAKPGNNEEEDLSDLSEDDDDDVISIAASSVGRIALDKLLSQVSKPKRRKRKSAPVRKAAPAAKRRRKRNYRDEPSVRVLVEAPTPETDDDGDEPVSKTDQAVDETSLSSYTISSEKGQAALHKLLSKVESCKRKGESKIRPRAAKKPRTNSIRNPQQPRRVTRSTAQTDSRNTSNGDKRRTEQAVMDISHANPDGSTDGNNTSQSSTDGSSGGGSTKARDSYSVGSQSVGQGGAALRALLSKVL